LPWTLRVGDLLLPIEAFLLEFDVANMLVYLGFLAHMHLTGLENFMILQDSANRIEQLIIEKNS
jgi:hypothetical protein